MQGVFSFFLVAVFLLASAGTYANELQSNTTTAKCKPPFGMPGMPGIPGIPGAPGSPGRDGFKGKKGSVGKQGSQGDIGIPGKIGPRGLEGPKGDKGENGTGIPGNTGPKGPQGPKGENGQKGENGRKGEIGTIGTKGRAGIPGNIGPRGLNGYKGEKGRKGEIGRMGTKGSAGIPGYAGPRGLKGSKGENGIGTKGNKGEAANIDPRQLANWKQCVWQQTLHLNDGKIKECSFNKLYGNTALKVSYQGNINVHKNVACNRWYFKFNGNECSGPMTIDSFTYTSWAGGRSVIYRNHFFEGYCENLARGTVNVELWVGKFPGYTLGDAVTGWGSVSRIMIEEVPPSQ